jgi:hypothetical protein
MIRKAAVNGGYKMTDDEVIALADNYLKFRMKLGEKQK